MAFRSVNLVTNSNLNNHFMDICRSHIRPIYLTSSNVRSLAVYKNSLSRNQFMAVLFCVVFCNFCRPFGDALFCLFGFCQ